MNITTASYKTLPTLYYVGANQQLPQLIFAASRALNVLDAPLILTCLVGVEVGLGLGLQLWG